MYFVINDGKLNPFTDDAREFLIKNDGETVKLEYIRERDARSNSLFWVRADKIAELLSNEQYQWKTYELVKATERKLGYVIEQRGLDGETIKEPESLAFRNMKQKRFDEFINEAYRVWATMLNTTVGEMLDNL